MDRLGNKVAVVTGGAAMLAHAAAEGARVVVSDVDEEAARAVAEAVGMAHETETVPLMFARMTRVTRTLTAGLLAGAALAAAGCGSDEAGDGGTGPVTVPVVLDLTGPAGFAGLEARRGIELAVAQANADGGVGNGRKIAMGIQDAASDPKQGASLTTRIARDDDVPVMMVGPSSAVTLASVPIAQREKLPVDAIESNAPGVVETGDHVYRSTTPQDAYTGLMAEHFANQGVKTVFQVFNNDVPANIALAEKTWPELAMANGFEITDSEGVAVSTTNFGTVASTIARERPDAVELHLSGAQYVSLISALRRAGYDGLIGAGLGASSGSLTPLGAAADGVLFVAGYTADTDDPNGAKFNKDIRAATGKDATYYAASGYDSTWFVIKALRNANGDFTRKAVLEGLAKAAKDGNPDAATGPVTFEERDARIKGSLVEWRDGKEHAIEP